ncbi:MAG: DUF4037 domain-containing protein [Clostridia bacterium]|nr:DUF4037 domain-containing protein [Clostridia bacterium]
MKGLELSRAYFEAYGRAMLERDFNDISGELCAGLFGSGSECFGYDSDVSRDHDFDCSFCIFVSDDVDSKRFFDLERGYLKLPREFMGVRRELLVPGGSKRRGVIRFSEFLLDKLGSPTVELTPEQWLLLPSNSLAECVNGELFYDPSGRFTKARAALRDMPDYAVRKRLAGSLALCFQAGQYNYDRCLAHSETGAARLAAFEFVKSYIAAAFLVNRAYAPYYKWCFRALRGLNVLGDTAACLEEILCLPPESSSGKVDDADPCRALIDECCRKMSSVLFETGIVRSKGETDLDVLAREIDRSIEREDVRNLHILFAAS